MKDVARTSDKPFILDMSATSALSASTIFKLSPILLMESSSFLIRPGVNVPSLGFTNRQLDISAQPIMAISESSPFDTLLTVTLENGVLTGSTLWPRLFTFRVRFSNRLGTILTEDAL